MGKLEAGACVLKVDEFSRWWQSGGAVCFFRVRAAQAGLVAEHVC
jgi:hypothetical protein